MDDYSAAKRRTNNQIPVLRADSVLKIDSLARVSIDGILTIQIRNQVGQVDKLSEFMPT